MSHCRETKKVMNVYVLFPLFDVITDTNCIPDVLLYLSGNIECWFECNCQIMYHYMSACLDSVSHIKTVS